jgi:hypothetical protein
VKFDSPIGKNDGSVNGKVYFSCARFHGSFVQPDQCTVLKKAAGAGGDADSKKPTLPFLSQIANAKMTTDVPTALAAGHLPPIRKLAFRERSTGSGGSVIYANAPEETQRLKTKITAMEQYIALLQAKLGSDAPPLPVELSRSSLSSPAAAAAVTSATVATATASLSSAAPKSFASRFSASTNSSPSDSSSQSQGSPPTSGSVALSASSSRNESNTPPQRGPSTPTPTSFAKPPPPATPAKPPPPPPKPSTPSASADGPVAPPPKPSLPTKPRPKSADPKALSSLIARNPNDPGAAVVGVSASDSPSTSTPPASSAAQSSSSGESLDRATLLKMVSPAQSLVAGKGFSGRSAITATSSTVSGSFVVKLCDANSELLDLPGMNLKSMITGPRGQVIEAKCTDMGNGSYEFNYEVEGAGDYTVIITCDNTPVGDSPYTKSYFASGDKRQRPKSIGIKNKFKSLRGDVTEFLNK